MILTKQQAWACAVAASAARTGAGRLLRIEFGGEADVMFTFNPTGAREIIISSIGPQKHMLSLTIPYENEAYSTLDAFRTAYSLLEPQ
jgi:hypothetical protein